MKNKISEFFYVLKCSMLILSAIIGAGLASGQEVVVFFAQYGFVSIFFLIILFFLFYYGLLIFFKFGKKIYSNDFIKRDKFFKIFETIMLFIFLIIGSAMLACLNDLLNQILYEFPFPVWSLIAIIISSLTVFLGVKTLLNLSVYLVPVIFIGIISVCIKASAVSPVSPPTFSSDLPSLSLLFLSSISYACINLITSNKLIFNLGNKLSPKNTKWVSLIVSLCLVILLGVMIFSILINDNMELFLGLPILNMSFLISKEVGYFYSFIMAFSILTTLFTTQFSFHETLRHKKKLLIFVLSISSFYIFSLFGFSEIVKYLYPVIGGFGFIMLFYIRNLSSKPCFNSADNKIHSTR